MNSGISSPLSTVELVVSDLARSVPFYETVIGLESRSDSGGAVGLYAHGAANDANPLLILHENPNASRQQRGPGLYHVAILYSSRAALANVVNRIMAAKVAVSGASDHQTHEAIYLDDPDGIGLELACDWPTENWPQYEGINPSADVYRPRSLDLQDLMAQSSVGAAEEPDLAIKVGHVHLSVSDVAEAKKFYEFGLGMQMQMQIPQAIFLSLNGYHHHLGCNSWNGPGHAGKAQRGAVGLKQWHYTVESLAELQQLSGRLLTQGYEVDGLGDGGVRALDANNNTVLIKAANNK